MIKFVKLSNEQAKLVEDNHNLIYSFLLSNGFSMEDYYDIAAIALCETALNYDPSKGSFSTYAYHNMLMRVLNEKRKNSAQCRIPECNIFSYDKEISEAGEHELTFLDVLADSCNVEAEVITNIAFRKYLSGLNKDRDKRILIMLRDGYKQTEICKVVGCSQPHVSRIRNKMYDYFKNL